MISLKMKALGHTSGSSIVCGVFALYRRCVRMCFVEKFLFGGWLWGYFERYDIE